MTHDILFRGKRADDGEWIESSSIKQISTDEIFLLGGRCWIKVVPSTVGRFTGLTDKNGRKIFEGDILKFGSGNYVVEWLNEHSKFLQVDGQFTRELYICINESEVIGNIYDDPELLGGDNNA